VVEDGRTEVEPDVAPPVENPAPVQEVAFEELHERVEEFPDWMLEGDAERLAVGAGSCGGAVTFTVAEELTMPLGP
jgi:hypothetical protein